MNLQGNGVRILRLRHYSPRTPAAYADWSRRFIGYAGGGARMPTSEDALAFLSHLATQRQVASSTQNQAFNAVLFLFRHVLRL